MFATVSTTPLLRSALLGDAIASAGAGLLLTNAAGPMAGQFELPEMLLWGAGAVMVPYAGLAAWAGTRRAVPVMLVRTMAVISLLWAMDSLVLLAFTAPTRLGSGFVLLQAALAGVFGALQWVGTRHPSRLIAPGRAIA